MKRSAVILASLGFSLALYAVGVVMLLTTDGANQIPTPNHAVVGGVLAMFATVGVFISGFVLSATENN